MQSKSTYSEYQNNRISLILSRNKCSIINHPEIPAEGGYLRMRKRTFAYLLCKNPMRTLCVLWTLQLAHLLL